MSLAHVTLLHQEEGKKSVGFAEEEQRYLHSSRTWLTE